MRDAYSTDFGYQFLIPLDAVPKHGLKSAVIDQDGDKDIDGELVASFRIRREQLTDGQLHSLQKGGVRLLEVSATPFVGKPHLALISIQSRTYSQT